jgi:hypothetical protein
MKIDEAGCYLESYSNGPVKEIVAVWGTRCKEGEYEDQDVYTYKMLSSQSKAVVKKCWCSGAVCRDIVCHGLHDEYIIRDLHGDVEIAFSNDALNRELRQSTILLKLESIDEPSFELEFNFMYPLDPSCAVTVGW